MVDWFSTFRSPGEPESLIANALMALFILAVFVTSFDVFIDSLTPSNSTEHVQRGMYLGLALIFIATSASVYRGIALR